MKGTKQKAHSCSALVVKKLKTQERRRRIKKLQWQLQWRGMGSKLEKGIEGKNMKDLEHRSQSLSTKSVSHRPIFLIFFFLFFFFFLFVCTSPKHLYRSKQPDFAGTAGIFFDTKQGVYLYRCTDRWYIPADTVRNWLPWSKQNPITK